MARPLELLEAMTPGGPPVLSWSTVTAPTLVLGRAPTEPALDIEACRAAGVRVVRRRSGGGAVLWDAGLLALDVVLPSGHRLASDDVLGTYRWLGALMAAGLRGLGVPGVAVVSLEEARADRRAPGAAATACFGALSPHEVTAGGRKVVGLSQVRRRSGALIQAGLALRLDPGALAGLLRLEPAERRRFRAALDARAGGLPGVAPEAAIVAVEAELCPAKAIDGRRRDSMSAA